MAGETAALGALSIVVSAKAGCLENLEKSIPSLVKVCGEGEVEVVDLSLIHI